LKKIKRLDYSVLDSQSDCTRIKFGIPFGIRKMTAMVRIIPGENYVTASISFGVSSISFGVSEKRILTPRAEAQGSLT
jgi:hypothetical protein